MCKKTFDDHLVEKNDLIDNAAYQLAVALVRTNNQDDDEQVLEWDMSYIGEIVDAAKEILEEAGHKVCHPFHAMDEEQMEKLDPTGSKYPDGIPCNLYNECTNPNCPLREKT